MHKTPKGWINKKRARNELIWWGNVRTNKDFDIVVVTHPTRKDTLKKFRGKWFVDKQTSGLAGKDRHLGTFKKRSNAISRAMKYMKAHQRGKIWQ